MYTFVEFKHLRAFIILPDWFGLHTIVFINEKIFSEVALYWKYL